MKKNKLSVYFIFISVLTFLTVFFSIVQKSYFNFKKPQELVEKNDLLKEFNPNLDLSIISTIESKNKNTDEAFDFSIIRPKSQPNTIQTSQPIATSTATPILTPTSTPTPTQTLNETIP